MTNVSMLKSILGGVMIHVTSLHTCPCITALGSRVSINKTFGQKTRSRYPIPYPMIRYNVRFLMAYLPNFLSILLIRFI